VSEVSIKRLKYTKLQFNMLYTRHEILFCTKKNKLKMRVL